MRHRKLIAVGTCATLALAGTGVAGAKKQRPPTRATIKAVQTIAAKPNRFVKDGLRWNKDVYHVRSGGTLHVTVGKIVFPEGPHTFTVVRKRDLPRTTKRILECKICETLALAHGVDPNNPEAPPRFRFLENGVGQTTPPNVDQPGDSAIVGPNGARGESVDLPVTAKKGTTLRFMCLVHPWMQAKVIVG
jgi:hypothetical protein